jgi:hypothetical protein
VIVTDTSLAATRDSYDALAAAHPDRVNSDLDDRPLDRALFAAFAELVRVRGSRPVADVGCGAGRVTILLSRLGRVLAPGGLLMMVFQIGDEEGHRTEFFGTPVSMDWYRQRPDDVARLLREAGFEIWTTAVREPDGNEKTAQGYLLAHKPSAENA